MKLKFVLLLLILSVSLFSDSRPTIDIDLKGGITISELSLEHSSIFDTDSTMTPQSPHIGLSAALAFTIHSWTSKYFAFQPEVLATQTGMVKKGELHIPSAAGPTDTTIYTEERYDFYHLRFPLLFLFKFPTQKIKPSLYAGPVFGVNLYSTYSQLSEDSTVYRVDLHDSEFRTESVYNFDFAIAAGGQVKVPLGPGHFILDIRYHHGLRDIITDREEYDEENELILTNPESKLRTFIAMAGYGFSF
jgi:hypothetical protein